MSRETARAQAAALSRLFANFQADRASLRQHPRHQGAYGWILLPDGSVEEACASEKAATSGGLTYRVVTHGHHHVLDGTRWFATYAELLAARAKHLTREMSPADEGRLEASREACRCCRSRDEDGAIVFARDCPCCAGTGTHGDECRCAP